MTLPVSRFIVGMKVRWRKESDMQRKHQISFLKRLKETLGDKEFIVTDVTDVTERLLHDTCHPQLVQIEGASNAISGFWLEPVA